MTKTTPAHNFFAYRWPVWIWLIGFPTLCAALMHAALKPVTWGAPGHRMMLVLAELLGYFSAGRSCCASSPGVAVCALRAHPVMALAGMVRRQAADTRRGKQT